MKLAIRGIRDARDVTRERLIIEVKGDTDVGQYLVLRVPRLGPEVASLVTRAFWFPDKEVRKGDVVILYSKDGNATEKKNTAGNTSHFFYWGTGEGIWADDHAAVLMHGREWQHAYAPAPSDEEDAEPI